MARLTSLLGLLTMILLAWLLSTDRWRINWRVVIGGLALQFIFALFILRTEPGEWLFMATGTAFQAAIRHVDAGSGFIFGINARPSDTNMPAQLALLRTFAFGVLPTIVFFSSLMSVLYYLGIMQWLVAVIARIMQVTLRTSGAESLSTAANIFVGQTEAPLVIRPYVADMTRSELNAVMVGGFATIAGGVMAAYVAMGIDAGHLMTASVISAPAALLIAKLMVPERESPKTLGRVQVTVADESINLIEAAAVGAADGMKLAINVAAMMIAFLAFLSLANGMLGWLGLQAEAWLGWESGSAWSLEAVFGVAFFPFAWIMGVPSDDCLRAGELLGIKMVANEFIAYDLLGRWALDTGAAAPHPRTTLILTYALAGFANFGSIGIQIGGIGSLAPGRRSDLAQLGLRAMIGGTLASFMTACVAGILIDEPRAVPSASPVRSLPAAHGASAYPLNRIGSSACNEVQTSGESSSASSNQMGSSSANSARTCRQAPHGGTPPCEATASARNWVAPAAIAAQIAARSAQTVRPYDAFSTLQPTWIRPVSSSSAAPT